MKDWTLDYSGEDWDWTPGSTCQFIGAAILGAGVLGAGASIYGASQQASAAKSAANTQAQAADQAAQVQWNEFQQTQANLQPYVNLGLNTIPTFQQAIAGTGGTNYGTTTGGLAAPIDLSDLSKLPGYQFTLDQGLQATQSGFAAQGLAKSGAALKGAANYAEGLAGTYWPTYFNAALGQNQQIYNMLAGPVATGQNAAAGLGSLGLQTATQATGLTTGAAAAQAAGTVGAANAYAGAANSLGGGASNTALLLALNNAGLFGAKPNPADENYVP